MHEIFNGFLSFDAKFWRTIIPLFISPGKVTKEYVAGKRSKYSNPFRFYFTVSILFFLVVGLSISKDKFEKLAHESKPNNSEQIIDDVLTETKKISSKNIDSIKNVVQKKMDNYPFPIPKSLQQQILKDLDKEINDSTAINLDSGNRISFGGFLGLDEFVAYQKKYPNSTIDVALDSLKYEKNFTNRFLYTRAKAANSFMTNEDSQEKYISDLLSYGSFSLFIFLPFFTLFLKFFYIRKKFTYVDHLIFVFHTQTVFFMLLTLLYLISFFIELENGWIFIMIFLIYLFLAMKKFYNQGFFKTIVKYFLLNFVYMIFGVLGVMIVALVSFALY